MLVKSVISVIYKAFKIALEKYEAIIIFQPPPRNHRLHVALSRYFNIAICQYALGYSQAANHYLDYILWRISFITRLVEEMQVS